MRILSGCMPLGAPAIFLANSHPRRSVMLLRHFYFVVSLVATTRTLKWHMARGLLTVKRGGDTA